MNIDGVLVPIVTPFDDRGAIDYTALEALLERLLTAGVRGIVACGTTGEGYALTEEERDNLMGFVAGGGAGRALLVAGVNDTCTAGSIARGRKARAMGYQALMLAPPIYCLPRQRGIIAHYTAVSAEVDLPIIMYNYPSRVGVEIGIEAVIELSRDENIIAIKESSGDLSRALTLLNAGLQDFQVVCGSDDQAADYLFWGARSWIAGGANYLPDAHVQMIAAAQAGDLNTVRCIMSRIMPVIKSMESADYIQKAKLGCAHIGIPVGQVRLPLEPISEADRAAFIDALKLALQ